MKYSSDEIAAEIRKDIVQGVFGSDDRLPPERLLAQRFNAARGTIRKAIMKLAQQNLVVKKPGSGTYVADNQTNVINEVIANATPLELIDARFALEPHMCRLAVLNARAADFRKLDELTREMEMQTGDYSVFAELDTSFHAAIAEASGNNLLIWMVSQINGVRNQELWSMMRHLTLTEPMIEQYNIQHARVVSAIKAREPEQAANYMKEHLETARLSLTRSSST